MGFFLRRLASSRAGSVAVEFAVTAPVLASLYLGTYELTDYVRAYARASATAQSVANLIAAQTSIVNAGSGAGSIGDYCTAANAVILPYSPSDMTVQVASITQSSSGASVDWGITCPDTSGFSPSTSLPSGLLNVAGDSVIEVQVTYTYSSATHFYLAPNLSVSQTAYARPRSNATIPLS